jgi:hypothetical protein
MQFVNKLINIESIILLFNIVLTFGKARWGHIIVMNGDGDVNGHRKVNAHVWVQWMDHIEVAMLCVIPLNILLFAELHILHKFWIDSVVLRTHLLNFDIGVLLLRLLIIVVSSY